MARNKYPEETVRRILDVAEELFYTKGYEHTTMADIVDGLGGLTKGAVYHHFKSKEEIFEAVFERANRPVGCDSCRPYAYGFGEVSRSRQGVFRGSFSRYVARDEALI